MGQATVRCHEPLCRRQTWTEASEHKLARASLTERAKTAIGAEVGADNHRGPDRRAVVPAVVAQVARAYGVGWETTTNAVRERGVPLVEDPARLDGVTALGLDETAFGKATGSTTRPT